MTDTKVIYEPSETKNWRALFPSKSMLLGSHNLNEGEELIATIANITTETVKGQSGREEEVPMIHFEGDKIPPMCLNITNSQTIASMYGDNYEGWTGKCIQVFATEVKDFGGGKTTGLRIRSRIPDVGEDVGAIEDALKACTTVDELKGAWLAVPKHLRKRLTEVKDAVKDGLA